MHEITEAKLAAVKSAKARSLGLFMLDGQDDPEDTPEEQRFFRTWRAIQWAFGVLDDPDWDDESYEKAERVAQIAIAAWDGSPDPVAEAEAVLEARYSSSDEEDA